MSKENEVIVVVMSADVETVNRAGKTTLYFQEVFIQLPGRPFPEAVSTMVRGPAEALPRGKYTCAAVDFLQVRDRRIGTVFGLPPLTAMKADAQPVQARA